MKRLVSCGSEGDFQRKVHSVLLVSYCEVQYASEMSIYVYTGESDSSDKQIYESRDPLKLLRMTER